MRQCRCGCIDRIAFLSALICSAGCWRRGRQPRFQARRPKIKAHRFGRKLKLPSTIAIKHPIRCLMAEDEISKADARAETTDICQPSVAADVGKRRFSFGASLSDGASVIGSSFRPYLGSSQSFQRCCPSSEKRDHVKLKPSHQIRRGRPIGTLSWPRTGGSRGGTTIRA